MLLLSLLLAYSIGCLATNRTEQDCSWTYYPGNGDDSFDQIDSLEECKSICVAEESCQSISYSPKIKGCWRFKSKANKVSRPRVDTYDYDCEVLKDVVPITGSANCITTNYPGPADDLYNAPNGVTWDYQIATFSIVWPPKGSLVTSRSTRFYIESVSFLQSDNLAYFRITVTYYNGEILTTKPLGPNDKFVVIAFKDDVLRVDFYLSFVDCTKNVSLIDVRFDCCFVGLFGLGSCPPFDVIKYIAPNASFLIVKPGTTSETFSVSIAPDCPYIELNLNCSGVGLVSFHDVSFGVSSGFDKVIISVWNGVNAVTVYDSSSVATKVFDAQGSIKFERNVIGDRIRSTFIPNEISHQGIFGSINFTKYAVEAKMNESSAYFP